MRPAEAAGTGVRVAESWTLLDSDRELAVADTWEGLEAALLAFPGRADAPNAIATLVAPGGDTLSVGVAGPADGDNPGLTQPLASVEYNRASQDPPYLVVVGDAALSYEDGGVAVFRFAGQWTEVLRRNCVTVDVMLRIARHFFESGTLPAWIPWEQV